MERLDHHQIWRGVREALDEAPSPIRLALSADDTLERRRAFDRLAAFVALRVLAATDPDEPAEDLTLPLFPEPVGAGDPPELQEPPMSVIEKHASFGRWLLDQRHRTDAIGALAKQAFGDSRFPRDGDPKAVSKHLNGLGADSETHQALEDAETDYLSY